MPFQSLPRTSRSSHDSSQSPEPQQIVPLRRVHFTVGTPPDERAEAAADRNRITDRHRETSRYLHQLLDDFRASPESTRGEVDYLISIILEVLSDNEDLLVHWLAYGERSVSQGNAAFWRSLKQRAVELRPGPCQYVETVDIDSLPSELLDGTYRRPLSSPHPDSRWSSPSASSSFSPESSLSRDARVAATSRKVADNLFEIALIESEQIENHTYVPLISSITNYLFYERMFENILDAGNERFGYDPSLPPSPPPKPEPSSPPRRGRSLRRKEVEESRRAENLEPDEMLPPVSRMPPRYNPPSERPLSARPWSMPRRGSPLRLVSYQEPGRSGSYDERDDITASSAAEESKTAGKKPMSVNKPAHTYHDRTDKHRARLMQIMTEDWPQIYNTLHLDLVLLREARIESERQRTEAEAHAEGCSVAGPSTCLPSHMRSTLRNSGPFRPFD